MHFTLNMMVNDKVFIPFLFGPMIIIVVDVYVCFVAIWLLFGYGNVFVCDYFLSVVLQSELERRAAPSTQIYDMGSLSISVTAAICTYGCSSHSTLFSFVCAVGVLWRVYVHVAVLQGGLNVCYK